MQATGMRVLRWKLDAYLPLRLYRLIFTLFFQNAEISSLLAVLNELIWKRK